MQVADTPVAAAPIVAGATKTFTPQQLLLPQPQIPVPAGYSLLNQQAQPAMQPFYGPPGYGSMPPGGMPFGAMPSGGMPYGGMPYGGMPYGGSQVHPAAFYDPPQPPPGDMSDPMMSGQSLPGPMMPSGEPMPGYDYGMQAGMGMDGGEMCPYCGGGGCGYCGGREHGLLEGFFSKFKPFGEGGRCAPRWYDISVDGLYWTRDEVSEFVPFSAFTRLGPTILSTDDLDYDRQPGMRFNSMIQMLPGIATEFTYFGMFSWTADASVTSPVGNELFSPFTDFGAINIGVGSPFDATDQAQFHSLRVSTTIDNFELNVRKYWTGPNCRLQGSMRWGVRYIYLVDDLNFFTLGRNQTVLGVTAPVGSSSTDVRTHNSLTGFQSGFDLWANIIPGVSVGTDGKVGIYGNHAKQNTHVVSSTNNNIDANLNETSSNNDVAVAGELNVLMIWRVNPNFTLRGGYSVLYVDGVALAPENFNTSSPFSNLRTADELDDNGNVLYHGGFAGFEWMW